MRCGVSDPSSHPAATGALQQQAAEKLRAKQKVNVPRGRKRSVWRWIRVQLKPVTHRKFKVTPVYFTPRQK